MVVCEDPRLGLLHTVQVFSNLGIIWELVVCVNPAEVRVV